MANDNDSRESKPPVDETTDEGQSSIVLDPNAIVRDGAAPEGTAPGEESAATELGAVRYVHAAFFAAGMLAAYVSGKLLLTLWNALADVPAVARAVPQLIQYGEDERASYTLVTGAILGALIVLHYYRKPKVRTWADEVAAELSRVTWPTRETVQNGTLVVLIAGAVGTLYVTLLDRFWGYLTNLVYGA